MRGKRLKEDIRAGPVAVGGCGDGAEREEGVSAGDGGGDVGWPWVMIDIWVVVSVGSWRDWVVSWKTSRGWRWLLEGREEGREV